MKKSIYFLMAISCLIACVQKEKENTQKTIPKNEVITLAYDFDTVKTKFNFLYSDEYSDKIEIEFNAAVNKRGIHLIKSSEPVFLLDYSLNQTYYLVYPNESVKITPSSISKEAVSVVIENDSSRAKEILFFEKLANHEMEDKDFLKKIKQLTVKSSVGKGNADKRFLLFLNAVKRKKMENTVEAFQYITDRFVKRKQFLVQYAKTHKISAKFKEIVLNFFDADYEADYYQVLTEALIKKSRVELGIDTLKASFVQNIKRDTNFFVPSVIGRLKNYLTYSFLKENRQSVADKMTFIDSNLEGKIKAHAKFLILKMMSLEKTSQELTYLNAFAKSNPQYLSYINENLLPQKIDISKTMLKDEAGNVCSFDEMINQYQGKVILLDFWASWCSPCIAEFPSSKNLQGDSALKNVVFIYLSIDENYNIWNKSAAQYKLGNHSYLIQNQRQSGLVKKLKIESIPRYVIINKKGEVVNSSAERPSSGLLEKQLLNYL